MICILLFAWLGESRVGWGVCVKNVSGKGRLTTSLCLCGFANYPLRTVTSLTLWIATMKLKWRDWSLFKTEIKH